MKCKVCKKRTNWDESYGYDDFIVCCNCFDRLYNKVDYNKKVHKSCSTVEIVLGIILEMGEIRKENKK